MEALDPQRLLSEALFLSNRLPRTPRAARLRVALLEALAPLGGPTAVFVEAPRPEPLGSAIDRRVRAATRAS